MKINELKRIAEENDYELTKSNVHYKLTRQYKPTRQYFDNDITINKLSKNRLWISIPSQCDERDLEMIKAAVEFAETPPDEREEEKKFYLRHKWMREISYGYKFLNKNTLINDFFISDKQELEYVKTKFTREEIDEIKEKYNTDLSDFEEVEVEE